MPPKKTKSKLQLNINGENIKLPRSAPQLPPSLVRTLENDPTNPPYRSIIFTAEYNIARHLIASGEQGPEMLITPDLAMTMRQTIGLLPGAPYLTSKSTWLHLAATTGDIPLFHEILRAGCHLEITDEHGRTPLYAGCDRLASLMQNGKLRSFPGTVDTARLQLDAKRIEKVCILLVQQHAVLDMSINGKTPLHMACATNSWDLIKVLLAHGADPAPASLPRSQHCISLLKTSAEKERFKALTNVPVPHERPARPCPCWSGETLEKCHARGASLYPYPAYFICRCKSRKTYEKCCKKKGVHWEEVWDPVEMWIQPNRVVTVKTPETITPEGRDNLAQQFEMMANIRNGSSGLSRAELISGAKRVTAAMVDTLVRSDHVDPAFAYAAKKVDFMPRPWTGQIPKVEQKTRMDEWNRAVDEYIALGTDIRMREDIENESKIGLGGGPLHPLCENQACSEKPEGRAPRSRSASASASAGAGPPVKLLVCVGCKKARYCTKECQREAWGEHKSLCKSGKAQEQLLYSQTSITQMHELMVNNPGLI